jgi:hypothetical protein
VLDEAAGVATVGPDQGQAVMRGGHLPKRHIDGDAVADIRGRDHHRQQQAERVDHDMPLAPVDQFAAVKATAVRPDDGIRFDGL